jgi:hypothetical protein
MELLYNEFIYGRVLRRIEWSVIWLNSLLFGFELLVQFCLICVLAGVVCFLFAGHGEPVCRDLDSGVVKVHFVEGRSSVSMNIL